MRFSSWKPAAVLVLSILLPGSPALAQQSCDNQCLRTLADAYLEALVAHAPSRVKLADSLRFVENITPLSPGQGLWATARSVDPDFRLYVPDAQQQTIGLIALIEHETEAGPEPGFLALRLQFENGLITEAEHLVGEVPPVVDLQQLQAPRAAFSEVVPQAERMSRESLVHIAESYYDALDNSDASLAPFAADCERQENGMISAGPDLPPAVFDSVDVHDNSPPPVAQDCIGQLNSRRYAYIDSIDHRRPFAVDREHGLVMSLSHFRQSMAHGPHRLIAADGSVHMWDEKREPYDLPAAHVFKITGGMIHQVEAIGIFVPYNAPTGWE